MTRRQRIADARNRGFRVVSAKRVNDVRGKGNLSIGVRATQWSRD